jgi:hypothetical protein
MGKSITQKSAAFSLTNMKKLACSRFLNSRMLPPAVPVFTKVVTLVAIESFPPIQNIVLPGVRG